VCAYLVPLVGDGVTVQSSILIRFRVGQFMILHIDIHLVGSRYRDVNGREVVVLTRVSVITR